MSELKPTSVQRRTAVPGFSGVGALMENDGHQICFVCADEATLRDQVAKLMPEVEAETVNPQPVTIIQSK